MAAAMALVQGEQPAPTFDDLWTLYPRRVARKEATRAWSQMTPEQQMRAIVALVAWRKEWLRRGELQYVPHCASWLRGERYEDELPQAVSAAPISASHVAFAPAAPPPARTPMPAEVRALIDSLANKMRVKP